MGDEFRVFFDPEKITNKNTCMFFVQEMNFISWNFGVKDLQTYFSIGT